MKTLILNGSPRRSGDTAALLSEFKKCLAGEIMEIHSYYDSIAPCTDCRYCWGQPGCIIKDKMQDVYLYLEECDSIVIASPVYFSELSGPLLGLASRFQTLYAGRKFRGKAPQLKPKKGAVILCGGGDGSACKAENTAKTLLKLMNAEYAGSVCSLETNTVAAADDTAALEAVRRLAERLNTKNDA